MTLLTQAQEKILSLMEQTGCLRIDQAARILGDDSGDYARRVLSQLRHMQRVYMPGETTAVLFHLSRQPPDADMLRAVDVLLDISGGNPLAVSAGAPPLKLRFLVEAEGGRIGSYAVVVVPPGREEVLSFQLENTERRTLILLLEDLSQRDKLVIRQPHYFAVFDERLHYYEGSR